MRVRNGYSQKEDERPADHMRHLHIRPLCAVSVGYTRVSVGTSPSKRPRQHTGLPLPNDGFADDEPHKDIGLLGGRGWVGNVVQSAPPVRYLIPYLVKSCHTLHGNVLFYYQEA